MHKKQHHPKPLRNFDYSLVGERLDGLLINVDRDLQRRGRQAFKAKHDEEDRCLLLLNLMIRFAKNSYDAVRYVAGNTPDDHRRKPTFVMVVPAINRQLLDLLFSLVYMLDDCEVRSLNYQKAGWRELLDEFHTFKIRFGKDPEWKQHFSNVRQIINDMVVRYGISKEEQRNSKLVPFWKHPYELKDEQTSSRVFLRYLEKWLYADTSAQAHLSFGGLVMVGPFLVAELVGGQDEEHVMDRILKQYHYRHFTRTAIVTLAIATEIDVYCNLRNTDAASYLWNVFAEYSPEAKEMLQYRYEKLMSRN